MPNKRRCTNCGYYREYSQQHPWGSTTATEYLAECAVEADDPGGKPCSHWKHYTEVEEEAANG